MLHRSSFLYLTLTLLITQFPTPALAMSYVMMSDTALLDQTELVVRATVVGELPPGSSGTDPLRQTVYLVDVNEVLVGEYTDTRLVVSILGRPLGSEGWQVYGSPHLQAGDSVLLFLESAAKRLWQPVQLVFGVFFQESIAGERVYLRSIDLQPPAREKQLHADFAAPRRAEAFESWLRGGYKSTPNYLAPQLRNHKFLFLVESSTGRTPRWFQFDSGTPVTWYARSDGQDGATYDEFAALVDALDAWSTVSGGNINLSYGGTVSSGPPAETNVGILLWDDPNNEIPGSWSNGGVLGFGGPIYFTSTQTFDGTAYHPIISARVVLQDGASAYFNGDGGRNGAEVITHELGHTLGFAHPCNDGCSGTEADATMRSFAHGDGRGAALRSDDRDAVQALYPALVNPDLLHADGFEN